MFFVATGVSYAQDKDILTDQGVVLAKSFDTTKLSKRAGFNVRFSAGGGKYAFDEGREAWYQNAKLVYYEFYESFGEHYIAPWKLVPLGQTDSVEAVLAGAADVLGKLDRSKIKFVTADGKGVAAKDDGTKWVLTIPSTEAGKTTCDIFAVYQKSKSKLQTVGKLRVASYEKQQHSVTLVPVGVDAPNVGEVQKRLNGIYAPYGVEFTVKVDDAIKELEGWKGRAFKLEGNGFFTRENADMAEIRKAYQNASSVDKDEYYIFVLGGTDAGSEDCDTQAHGAQGDMPRGQRFGYIFGDRATDLGWLLAHELGHGVFTLKHLNESNYAGKSSLGTLANLMDYTGSTQLAAFQWNVMANPAILTGLDSDDASKQYGKYGVYFVEIANYLGVIPKYHYSSVINDNIPDDCPFAVLSYHNQNNDIVGYGASLNTIGGTRHAYVILGKDNLKPFIENASKLAMLANIFYIGGTPTAGQIEMIMGSKWKGLGMMWKEALTDPGYYEYLLGVTSGILLNLPAIHNQPAHSLSGKMKIAKIQDKLPRDISITFKNQTYITLNSVEDIVTYRRFGGLGSDQAKLNGRFVTTEEMLRRTDLALLTKWNTMQFEAKVIIPKGTKINYGKIAPQGKYLGGADQIYFDQQFPDHWVISIKDLKTGNIYFLEEFKRTFPNMIKR